MTEIIVIDVNIDIEKSECCVCYENTTNKLVCNHLVCDECTSKMKSCPMCRQPYGDEEMVEQHTIMPVILHHRRVVRHNVTPQPPRFLVCFTTSVGTFLICMGIFEMIHNTTHRYIAGLLLYIGLCITIFIPRLLLTRSSTTVTTQTIWTLNGIFMVGTGIYGITIMTPNRDNKIMSILFIYTGSTLIFINLYKFLIKKLFEYMDNSLIQQRLMRRGEI